MCWFFFFFFSNSTLSLVVLLSDILTIQKLLLLFKDCGTDSCDVLCQSRYLQSLNLMHFSNLSGSGLAPKRVASSS